MFDLFVDGENLLLEVYREEARRAGYIPLIAGDAREAWAHFDREKPDVVVTDIKMPVMDGKAFCQQTNPFKKDRPFLTIIVSCSLTYDGWKWIDDMDDTRGCLPQATPPPNPTPPLERFLIEFIRTNEKYLFDIFSGAQVLSIIMVLIGVYCLFQPLQDETVV